MAVDFNCYHVVKRLGLLTRHNNYRKRQVAPQQRCIDMVMVDDDGCMFSRAVGIESCEKCKFEDCCDDMWREQKVKNLMETGCTEKEAVLIVLERDGIK